MPGFDTEIARMAQRLLIQGRPIDYHLGVIATKVTPGVPGVKPVTIELTDFKTKKVVDTLEVDACMVATGRAPYTNGARGLLPAGLPVFTHATARLTERCRACLCPCRLDSDKSDL